ncbi:CsbD family protein [Spirillospora sp. NPDC048911]|uniref:CsbD family protein n=1 Tax=Spirillospora sp. NPDC048911 TaxID=3364527 RepID=UPI0037209D01
MGFLDKFRNKTQRTRGRGNERMGRQTRNRSLEGKGKAGRYKGGAKQVGQQAKDAAREVRKTFRR